MGPFGQNVSFRTCFIDYHSEVTHKQVSAPNGNCWPRARVETVPSGDCERMTTHFIKRRLCLSLTSGLAAVTLGALSFSATPSLAQNAGVVAEAPGFQIGQDVGGPASVADLAEQLLDSVVNISTSQTVAGRRTIPRPNVPEGSPFEDFFDEFFNRNQEGNEDQQGRPRRVQSLGSGFIIDAEEGLVVTNNHVIEDADEIVINFADGGKLDAEVIGRDEKTDLAVLKVDPDIRPLVETKFGDSDEMRVGDWVMAIGNPFGLGGTVTLGIVSAVNRDINSGPYDNFLQTDASINRGNSGGPLFNMRGEVVGVNTAIISPSGGSIGIGFSVPTSTAVNVIDQLREFGETRRGWLGVRIQQVTDDMAERLGLNESSGAFVAGVTATGPAEAAGIENGDIILEFDGRPVPEMRDLPRMVADAPVGKKVPVVILRDGDRVTIDVELGRLEEGEQLALAEANEEAAQEEAQPEALTERILGMELSVLTDTLRQEYAIAENIEGVVVTGVEPGSSAADKRIVVGDVILEVGHDPVENPEDVEQRVNDLKEEDRSAALLLLANEEGDVRFVAVRIDS